MHTNIQHQHINKIACMIDSDREYQYDISDSDWIDDSYQTNGDRLAQCGQLDFTNSTTNLFAG